MTSPGQAVYPRTVLDRLPTAPVAATGLIAGYGVAVGSGSRPLGGVVLALFGLVCLAVWARSDGRRTTVLLSAVGLGAFAVSHVLALAIGAWPAVLLVSAVTFAVCWRVSDAKRPSVERAAAARASS